MLASLRPPLARVSHVLPRRAFASSPTLKDVEREKFVDMIADIPTPTSTHASRKWRVFAAGEVVSPNELRPERCEDSSPRFRRPIAPPPAPNARYQDIFRQLNVDPVDFALNPAVLQNYVSEMGKIYGRNITGLSSRSQRRLGKAIRRARMIGIMPQLSRPTRQWVDRFKY